MTLSGQGQLSYHVALQQHCKHNSQKTHPIVYLSWAGCHTKRCTSQGWGRNLVQALTVASLKYFVISYCSIISFRLFLAITMSYTGTLYSCFISSIITHQSSHPVPRTELNQAYWLKVSYLLTVSTSLSALTVKWLIPFLPAEKSLTSQMAW